MTQKIITPEDGQIIAQTLNRIFADKGDLMIAVVVANVETEQCDILGNCPRDALMQMLRRVGHDFENGRRPESSTKISPMSTQ